MVKHELRVENLKARVEIQKHELKFKSTSCNSNPRVTSLSSRVTSSNPLVQESLNH